jgi:hypothetical protein
MIMVFLAGLLIVALGMRLLRRGQQGLHLSWGGRGQTTTTPSACDDTLWEHVYHPQRLRVLESCRTVEGTIISIRKEEDGDMHIRMDVEDKSLLNERNLTGQHGDLVIEPVCVNQVTQADAVAACGGFTSALPIPRVGERVRVTGAYITDREHGWNEIHPVTRIEILP